MLRKLFACGLFCCSIVSHCVAFGQTVPERYAQIPSDSLVVSSIEFDAIRNLKELEMIPWEILAAVGKQEIGIDPMLISTIDFTTGMPSVNGPEFGVVIKTKAPVDIAQLNKNYFADMTVSPKNKNMKIRSLNNAAVKVIQSEPSTLLVGSEGTLRRMVAGKSRPSRAVELVSTSKYPIRSVTMLDPLRPIMDGALADASEKMPPQFVADLQILVDELEYFTSESNVGLTAEFVIKLGAKNKESIDKISNAIARLRKDGLVFADTMLKQQIENDPQMSDEVRAAAFQYLERMKVFLTKADLWKVVGNEIVLDGKMAYSVPTIGVMTGLLLPAVQAARESARRMQSSNNLKQIMLAAHNYEAAYRCFPPRALEDANENKLLSWRVAILPFIAENELYQQFHLNEPWDSEHNLTLLEKMPATFKHPEFIGPAGHTVYLLPYRSDTVWSLEKPRMQNITDGTSNTLACIEVSDENAVPWTKPDDIDLDEVDIFDFFRGETFSIALFDGSVHVISDAIDPATMEALITSQGGEVVNLPFRP